MERIPYEILEKILIVDYIDVKDLCNFGSTCKNLREFIFQNTYVWKEKYKERWPKLYRLCHNGITNWCEEVRHMLLLRQKILNLLQNMSEDYYPARELGYHELKDWKNLVTTRSDYFYIFHFLLELIDEDQHIGEIDSVPFLTRGSLSLRYYVLRILYFISTRKLELDWNSFLCKSEDFRTLEKVATFLAQRFQCDIMITPESISDEFDKLANEVRNYLRVILPDHPLFSVPEDTLETWKECKLKHQQYDAENGMSVLEAIVYVLWEQNGFRKTTGRYFDCDHFNINRVLDTKCGSPIMILIIYESVARRLGIHLEPVTHKSVFSLEYSHETNYLVDVFRGTLTASDYSVRITPTQTVVDTILKNLEVGTKINQHPKYGSLFKLSILEWKLMLDPQNMDLLMDLAHMCGSLGINKSKLYPYLISLAQNDPTQAMLQCGRKYDEATSSQNTQPLVVRPEGIAQYAIGMVMRLAMCGSLCVISDWEPTCKNLQSCLSLVGTDQPNYTMLFDDGSSYNIPECFLEVALQPRRITHPDLGAHFTHFYMTHYVPNELKERLYPGDRLVRIGYHKKVMAANSPRTK